MGIAGVIGIPTVLASLNATNAHFHWWWPTNWMVVPLVILVAGLVLLFVPVRRSPQVPSEAVTSGRPGGAECALPPPPLSMSIVPDPDGERLRLLVRNKGARGLFTARVTGILDPNGRPAPGRQSWPVPWLEDGSIRPADLPQFDGRTLDFARFNAGESDPWPHRAYWLFSSLPEPVGVTYGPVRNLDELETQRFLVTVRIIRTEPFPDHMDRQFSIGVTSGGQLVCESISDGSEPAAEDQPPPPLVVLIMEEDSKFDNWRHIALIAALHVEVENTTDAPIRVGSYSHICDTEGAPFWSDEASSEDRLSVERELARREQAQEYGQPLRNYARIPPRSRVSGWLLSAVNRPQLGGTPECVVTVADELGNEYQARLPKRGPQTYGP